MKNLVRRFMFYCHAIELNNILTNLLHVSPVIKDNTQIPHLLVHHPLFHNSSFLIHYSTILHSSSFIPDLLIYHPSFKTSLFLILNPTPLHFLSFILHLFIPHPSSFIWYLFCPYTISPFLIHLLFFTLLFMF